MNCDYFALRDNTGMRAFSHHSYLSFVPLVNDLTFAYNEFRQLVREDQSHEGEVDVPTTPNVEYRYADGSNNTIRPTGIVYPNGRELSYDYGTSGGIDDACSRVSAIVDDDATRLAEYAYLGRQVFVEQDNTEPDGLFSGSTGRNRRVGRSRLVSPRASSPNPRRIHPTKTDSGRSQKPVADR